MNISTIGCHPAFKAIIIQKEDFLSVNYDVLTSNIRNTGIELGLKSNFYRILKREPDEYNPTPYRAITVVNPSKSCQKDKAEKIIAEMLEEKFKISCKIIPKMKTSLKTLRGKGLSLNSVCGLEARKDKNNQ